MNVGVADHENEPNPSNIMDWIEANGNLDLTVSEDAKSLSGTVTIGCSNSFSEAACAGVANMMERINGMTPTGLTIDINVEVREWFPDLKVNTNPIISGDRTSAYYQAPSAIAEFFGSAGTITVSRRLLAVGFDKANLTYAHELGHALGVGHAANTTNTLMSYSKHRSNRLSEAQARNLMKAYGQ